MKISPGDQAGGRGVRGDGTFPALQSRPVPLVGPTAGRCSLPSRLLVIYELMKSVQAGRCISQSCPGPVSEKRGLAGNPGCCCFCCQPLREMMCQMSVFWRSAPVEKSGVELRSTADVRPGPTLGRNQLCYRRITPVSESDARFPLTSSLVSHAGCVICVLSVELFATLSADTGRLDLIFWFGATRPTFGAHQAFEHAIISSWHAGKGVSAISEGRDSPLRGLRKRGRTNRFHHGSRNWNV